MRLVEVRYSTAQILVYPFGFGFGFGFAAGWGVRFLSWGLCHSRFLTFLCGWSIVGLVDGPRIDISRFISRRHCLEKEK